LSLCCHIELNIYGSKGYPLSRFQTEEQLFKVSRVFEGSKISAIAVDNSFELD
jgi:hypothetical protein